MLRSCLVNVTEDRPQKAVPRCQGQRRLDRGRRSGAENVSVWILLYNILYDVDAYLLATAHGLTALLIKVATS